MSVRRAPRMSTTVGAHWGPCNKVVEAGSDPRSRPPPSRARANRGSMSAGLSGPVPNVPMPYVRQVPNTTSSADIITEPPTFKYSAGRRHVTPDVTPVSTPRAHRRSCTPDFHPTQRPSSASGRRRLPEPQGNAVQRSTTPSDILAAQRYQHSPRPRSVSAHHSPVPIATSEPSPRPNLTNSQRFHATPKSKVERPVEVNRSYRVVAPWATDG